MLFLCQLTRPCGRVELELTNHTHDFYPYTHPQTATSTRTHQPNSLLTPANQNYSYALKDNESKS